MHITKEQMTQETIVLLDNEIVYCVVEANDDEGWVDVADSPFPSPPGKNQTIVRKKGVVRFVGPEEIYARVLEKLSAQIRSGEAKVTSISSTRPMERWFAADPDSDAVYFRIQDMTLSFHYHIVKDLAAELIRKEKWLKENPGAEKGPPFPLLNQA